MTNSTFCNFFENKNIDKELLLVLQSIEEASKKIRKAIETAEVGKAGTMNSYGEEQLALDVLSDKIMQEELKKNSLVGLIASEELPDEIKIGEGKFAVAYDPLDGSSLVDVNLSVGTIFSVYETKSFIGTKGSEMKAAGFIVYGPRTTMMISCGQGVQEFTLTADGVRRPLMSISCESGDSQDQEGKFILSRENIKVGEGKMFAPGNLRAISEREDYLKLMEFWMKEQYTLRYSGGMVPDINQILLKGKGIFTYPGQPSKPDGKLRLLFECGPMSYLMEQAGGAGTDGKMRILEKKLGKIDQRTPIYVGSKEEVSRAEEYLK